MEKTKKMQLLCQMTQSNAIDFLDLNKVIIKNNNTLLEFHFIVKSNKINIDVLFDLYQKTLNLRFNVKHIIFIVDNYNVLAKDDRFEIAKRFYDKKIFPIELIDGEIVLSFKSKEIYNDFRKTRKKFDYFFSLYGFAPSETHYRLNFDESKDFFDSPELKIESDTLTVYENENPNSEFQTTFDVEDYKKMEIKDLPFTKDEVENLSSFGACLTGEIFFIETKDIRSKTLYSFYITDYNDSIVVKSFYSKKSKVGLSKFKVGDTITVKGMIKFDQYSNDVVILMENDCIIKTNSIFKKEVPEFETIKRVELNVRTTFSAQDSLTVPEKFLSSCKDYGIDTLGVMDLDGVQAYPEVFNLKDKYKVKPIYGATLNMIDESKFKIYYGFGEENADVVGVDIETTGFSVNYDDIIQIACVKKVNGIMETLNLYVKPDLSSLSQKIIDLTKITEEDLENGVSIIEALTKFLDFVGNKTLVAHNATFDIDFLQVKIKKYLNKDIKFNFIDTLNFSKVLLEGTLSRFGLDVVARKLGVDLTQHHSANYDAECCLNIYYGLMKKLEVFHQDKYSEYPVNIIIPYKSRSTELTILNCIDSNKENIINLVQEKIDVYEEEKGTFSCLGDKDFIKNYLNNVGILFNEKGNLIYVNYNNPQEKKLINKLKTTKGAKDKIQEISIINFCEKKGKATGLFSFKVTNVVAYKNVIELNVPKTETFVKIDKYSNDFNKLNELINYDTVWKKMFPTNVSVIVKNQLGLKNLYKIVSESHTQYVGKCVYTPKRVIEKYREGILIGSSDYNGLFKTVYEKDAQNTLDLIDFYDYIELQPFDSYNSYKKEESDDIKKNLVDSMIRLSKISEEKNKLVVVDSCAHYITKDEQKYYNVYVDTPQVGGKYHQLKGAVPSDFYLRTGSELLNEFSFFGPSSFEFVFDNPRTIADSVDNEIKIVKDRLCVPEDDFLKDKELDIVGHKIPSVKEEFKSIVKSAMNKYVVNKKLPPLIFDRIKKEMSSIINNGFSVNYLIAYLLVKQSNKDGYVVGSRGSVGSSFVAYLMGITEVNSLPPHYYCPNCHYIQFKGKNNNDENTSNPILQEILDSVESGFDLPNSHCPCCGKPLERDGHDIPFETFLGFNGDKVPDIDLNFSGEYQGKAHLFCREVFGEDHAFRAGTISTVAEKTACGYVRKDSETKGIHLRNAEVFRQAKRLEGTKRTTGQHPGGIIVIPSNYDVYDFTPVQYPAEDTEAEWKTTHFDYHGVLDETLLKLDILGHDDPTILKKLMDYVKENPLEFPFKTIKEIPLDDKSVYRMLYPDQNGIVRSLAIPEFGTKFVTEMLNDTKPDTFAQLVKVSGLSHGTDVWLNNAKELVTGNTRFKAIPFKNVIGCRDDIMVQLMYFGCEPSKAFEIMEFVRKGKVAKNTDPKKWNELKEYLKEKNVPEWYIWSCERIQYMFPKAHATAYVLSAMRIAWFKVYKPLLFYSTYFSVRAKGKIDLDTIIGGKEKTKNKIIEINEKGYDATALELDQRDVLEVALECLSRGIDIIVPDLKVSKVNDFVPLKNQNAIVCSLTSIAGLGEDVAIRLLESQKENDIKSIADLKTRKIVNKTVLAKFEELNIIKG